MNIAAHELPWEWLTKVAKPRGRKKRFTVMVNGAKWLVADANNEVQLLRGLRFPLGAVVRVIHPNRRKPCATH